MSTTLKRVRGQDVELVASKLGTGATALTNWTDFSADVMISEDDASAASAGFDQFTIGRRKATGSVKGFVGTGETIALANLPQPGDELLTLAIQTVTEGANLLPDLGNVAKFGKIIVVKTHYGQTNKPGEYSFDWRSGGM